MVRIVSSVAICATLAGGFIAPVGAPVVAAQSERATPAVERKKPRKRERWREALARKREAKKEARRVQKAREFVESVRVPGTEVANRVRKLTRRLTWFRSLPAAQEEARRTGRPILWIHALGEIDGFL